MDSHTLRFRAHVQTQMGLLESWLHLEKVVLILKATYLFEHSYWSDLYICISALPQGCVL